MGLSRTSARHQAGHVSIELALRACKAGHNIETNTLRGKPPNLERRRITVDGFDLPSRCLLDD